MSLSQCPEKYVVILYFINPGTRKPEVTQKTCGVFSRPKHINLRVKLFCVTDEMIQEEGQELQKEIQSFLVECTEFVIRMIDITSQRGNFVNSLLTNPQRTFFYYTPSDGISTFKTCSTKFKIINVIPTDKFAFVEEVIIRDSPSCEQNILYIPHLRYMMDRMQSALECMSWYKHYLQKAFECASGRLLQISATCFLNTVINGLILSAGTQALLMNEYIKNGNFDQYEDIQSLACPSESTQNSKKFILTLVNTILAQRKRLRKKTLDIMVQASSASFSVSSSGSHGSPLFSIIQILISLGVNFLLKIPQFYYIDPSYDLSSLFSTSSVRVDPTVQYVLPFPISRVKYYQAIESNQIIPYLKSFSRHESFTMDQTDILLEYQKIFQYREKQEIIYENDFQIATKVLQREGVDFDLQFCSFIIEMQTPENTFLSHAVVGIICNGIFQLYDSQQNLFFEYDWQTMHKNLEFVTELEFRYQKKVLNFYREFTVYMRSDLVKKLSSEQRRILPTEDI